MRGQRRPLRHRGVNPGRRSTAGDHHGRREAQDAIREQAHAADLVLMLSTMLHSVAVGNCLPSTTKTVCVDINPATVTQLLDCGSAQGVGMVTDVGTFVPILADNLLGE